MIKYRAYKDACKEGRVAIPMARGTVIFCLPIPKMSKAKTMALEATDHTKENADIDNLMKGLMDAVLIKDGEVCSLSPHKIWSSKPGFFITYDLLLRKLNHKYATIHQRARAIAINIPPSILDIFHPVRIVPNTQFTLRTNGSKCCISLLLEAENG